MKNLIGFELLNLDNRGQGCIDKIPRLTLSSNGISIYHFPDIDKVEAIQISYNKQTNEFCASPASKNDESIITRQKTGTGNYYFNSSSLSAKRNSKDLCKTDKQKWVFKVHGIYHKEINAVIFPLDKLVENKTKEKKNKED